MTFKAGPYPAKPTDMRSKESGQSLVEYLIIVAIVAVGGIGVMRVLGQSINMNFARIARSLGAQVDGHLQAPRVRPAYTAKRSLRSFINGNDTEKDTDDDDSL